MADTLLAKKSGGTDNAVATDDTHHDKMANDPTITSFPQGSSFGATTSTTTQSSFGGTSNGFGSTSSSGFGSTSGGFGSSSMSGTGSFGSSTGGFGGGSSFGGSSGFGGSSAGGFGGGMNSGMGMPGQPGMGMPQQNLTSSAAVAVEAGAESTVKLDKEATDWINKKWRPMMGWMYMATCTADFVIFPVLWSVLQALSHGQVTSQWQPLTLQGAGLYHVAMGAVLGIAAYGRTKEKVAGAA